MQKESFSVSHLFILETIDWLKVYVYKVFTEMVYNQEQEIVQIFITAASIKY